MGGLGDWLRTHYPVSMSDLQGWEGEGASFGDATEVYATNQRRAFAEAAEEVIVQFRARQYAGEKR